MNDRFPAIVAAAVVILASSPAPRASYAAAPPPTGSPAASASPATVASLLAQAQVDSASGRNEAARDKLLKATALDPSNVDVLKLLGDVQYRLGNYVAAEAAYKTVIAGLPNDRSLHNRLGGVYAAEGRFQDAVTQFTLSLPSQEGAANLVDVYTEEGRLPELEAQDQLDMDRAPPDDPYTRFELATVLEAEKKYSDAIGLYNQALEFKPNFWEARNGLGNTYGEVGRTSDAIAQYKMAIEEDPKADVAWMNWGVELIGLDDSKTAIEKIQKCLAINPQFAKAYANLGVAYSNLGNFQRAIELYQQALVYDPRLAEVYNNMGVDYYEHGLYNLAEAAFIKGVAIHPRNPRLHRDLGFYYQQRGKYPQSISEYKLALYFDPSDELAKTRLAEVEALVKH
jgi:tetratricopeptide (TPR) repeat protein